MVFGYGSKLSILLNWMISILNIRYSKIRWYQTMTQFLVLFGVFQKTLIIFLMLFQDKESLDDKLPSSQCYHPYLQMMDFIYFYLLTFSYSTMNSRSFCISNKMVKLFAGMFPAQRTCRGFFWSPKETHHKIGKGRQCRCFGQRGAPKQVFESHLSV